MTWIRKLVQGTVPSRPATVGVVMLAVIGGWTAGGAEEQSSQLIQAVRGGDRGALLELLQGGANPNVLDADGYAPLHYAVRKLSVRRSSAGAYGLVVELLRYGADPTVRDARGLTPLAQAVLRGSEALIAKLLDAGGDPNQATPNGLSLLAVAEMAGNEGAAAAIRAAGGVYGSSPQEQMLAGSTTRIGAFVQDMQARLARRSARAEQPTVQEWEDEVVNSFRKHFEIHEDDPSIDAFRKQMRARIASKGRCSSCDKNK